MTGQEAGRVGLEPDGQETQEAASVGERFGGSSVQDGSENGVQASRLGSFLDPGAVYRPEPLLGKSVTVRPTDDSPGLVGKPAVCRPPEHQLERRAGGGTDEGIKGGGNPEAGGNGESAGYPSKSNTGYQSSQTGPKPKGKTGSVATSAFSWENSSPDEWRRSKGGHDTLHYQVFGGARDAVWSVWRSRLERAKSRAEAAGGPVEVEGPGGVRGLVRPRGTRHGQGKGCVHFPWVFETAGVVVQLVDNPGVSAKRPLAFVEVGSNPLVVLGGPAIVSGVGELLHGFGLDVERELIARADLALDLPGVGMGAFREHLEGGRFVCKSRKRLPYYDGDDVQTVYWGRKGSDLFCRAYDKVQDCCADPVKGPIMAVCRWGSGSGLPAGGASRTEFQLRGVQLRKRYGVRSCADLWAKGGAMWDDLTSNWLRLTGSRVDRDNKHQARCKESDLWRRVREEGLEAFGSPVEFSGAVACPDFDDNHRVLIGRGCFISWAALRGLVPESEAQVDRLAWAFARKIRGEWWEVQAGKIRAKRAELEASTPCVSAIGAGRAELVGAEWFCDGEGV